MRLLLSLSCLLLSLSLFAQDDQGLMPYPAELTLHAGRFRMSDRFKASLACDPQDDILVASANRVFQGLNRKSGLYFRQASLRPGPLDPGASLRITAPRKETFALGIDESYTLRINASGVQLEAANSIGAIRGLETLQQLLLRDSLGFYLPHVEIRDQPRFRWRGLMIDVARHFIPMDVLKRNVDAMATVKMNVLHLHLSDDEGFRIESKALPRLHQLGANGQYYTQEEMKGLIRYARERGIMIVPELDMPGHTRSWFAGYPEMASAPGPYSPGPRFTFGENDTAINLASILSAATPAIDPTREEVYQLIDKLIAEMAALFPAPYLHIGADENNGAAWRQNPKINAFMEQKGYKDTHALQTYFVSRLYQLVRKRQKTMIGWEELYGPGLPKDVVVQKWLSEGGFVKSAGKPEAIAAAGSPVILSVGFYTDLFMPAYIHYLNPSLPATTPALIWGGEAAQWTEITDARNIETRIWPRAAAIAERLWSPAHRTDVEDMYRRLFTVSRQLDEQGLQHITAYETGLRRLAGPSSLEQLKTLTDVLAPVKGYKNLMGRMSQPARLGNPNSPLVRVADIIPVDSETKRRFRTLVGRYLSERRLEDGIAIRQQLQVWVNNHPQLLKDPVLAQRLSPVMAHSANLTTVAAAGIQAMDWLQRGAVMPEEAQKNLLVLIQSARKPAAETELDILLEIESLVKQKLLPEPTKYATL